MEEAASVERLFSDANQHISRAQEAWAAISDRQQALADLGETLEVFERVHSLRNQAKELEQSVLHTAITLEEQATEMSRQGLKRKDRASTPDAAEALTALQGFGMEPEEEEGPDLFAHPRELDAASEDEKTEIEDPLANIPITNYNMDYIAEEQGPEEEEEGQGHDGSSESNADSLDAKKCNCKKSRCLKLYCECFSSGIFCEGSCMCRDCLNVVQFTSLVTETRQHIIDRSPNAFAPKVSNGGSHKKGCHCKKSRCLKKYCECYQANVPCTEACRCENCMNNGPNAPKDDSPPDSLLEGGALPSSKRQNTVSASQGKSSDGPSRSAAHLQSRQQQAGGNAQRPQFSMPPASMPPGVSYPPPPFAYTTHSLAPPGMSYPMMMRPGFYAFAPTSYSGPVMFSGADPRMFHAGPGQAGYMNPTQAMPMAPGKAPEDSALVQPHTTGFVSMLVGNPQERQAAQQQDPALLYPAASSHGQMSRANSSQVEVPHSRAHPPVTSHRPDPGSRSLPPQHFQQARFTLSRQHPDPRPSHHGEVQQNPALEAGPGKPLDGAAAQMPGRAASENGLLGFREAPASGHEAGWNSGEPARSRHRQSGSQQQCPQVTEWSHPHRVEQNAPASHYVIHPASAQTLQGSEPPHAAPHPPPHQGRRQEAHHKTHRGLSQNMVKPQPGPQGAAGAGLHGRGAAYGSGAPPIAWDARTAEIMSKIEQHRVDQQSTQNGTRELQAHMYPAKASETGHKDGNKADLEPARSRGESRSIAVGQGSVQGHENSSTMSPTVLPYSHPDIQDDAISPVAVELTKDVSGASGRMARSHSLKENQVDSREPWNRVNFHEEDAGRGGCSTCTSSSLEEANPPLKWGVVRRRKIVPQSKGEGSSQKCREDVIELDLTGSAAQVYNLSGPGFHQDVNGRHGRAVLQNGNQPYCHAPLTGQVTNGVQGRAST